jgi:hypothetical protein
MSAEKDPEICPYCGYPLDEWHTQTRRVHGTERTVECSVLARGYVQEMTCEISSVDADPPRKEGP